MTSLEKQDFSPINFIEILSFSDEDTKTIQFIGHETFTYSSDAIPPTFIIPITTGKNFPLPRSRILNVIGPKLKEIGLYRRLWAKNNSWYNVSLNHQSKLSVKNRRFN